MWKYTIYVINIYIMLLCNMHIHTFMNACAHKYTRIHANTPFRHACMHTHCTFHLIAFQCIALHGVSFHFSTFHCNSLRPITLHTTVLYRYINNLQNIATHTHTSTYIIINILFFLLFKLFFIYVVQRWFPQLVSETAFVAWKGDSSEVEDFWLGQALGYLAAPRLGGLLVDCCLGDRRSQNNTA